MDSDTRTRWLELSLAVAPITAVVCTAATWIRFYLTGSLELRPGPALSWTSGSASCALAVLGACCVVACFNVDKDDLSRILKCSLLIHGCLLLAIPLQDTDFYVYLGHGTLVANGFNPHVVGVVALGDSPFLALSPWKNTPSPYGPVATLVTAIGGVLGKWTHSPIWVNGATYKIVTGILDFWGLFVASAVARRAATTSAVRGFAVFALNPLFAWTVAAQAHNDGLIILSSVIFLWAFQREPRCTRDARSHVRHDDQVCACASACFVSARSCPKIDATGSSAWHTERGGELRLALAMVGRHQLASLILPAPRHTSPHRSLGSIHSLGNLQSSATRPPIRQCDLDDISRVYVVGVGFRPCAIFSSRMASIEAFTSTHFYGRASEHRRHDCMADELVLPVATAVRDCGVGSPVAATCAWRKRRGRLSLGTRTTCAYSTAGAVRSAPLPLRMAGLEH